MPVVEAVRAEAVARVAEAVRAGVVETAEGSLVGAEGMAAEVERAVAAGAGKVVMAVEAAAVAEAVDMLAEVDSSQVKEAAVAGVEDNKPVLPAIVYLIISFEGIL